MNDFPDTALLVAGTQTRGDWCTGPSIKTKHKAGDMSGRVGV